MVTPVVVPVLAPMVFSKLSYHPDTDFAPVVRLCDFNFGLAVGPGAPVKNLKEYVAWLKANPQKANFGSPAAGSLPHFFGEMIGHALGVDMIHVPFNGGAALQSAVVGGHTPAGIDVVMEWQQNARAGKVAMPDVRERFAALGLEAGGGSAADLQRTMQEDTRRWAPVVKKSGFRAN